MKKTFPVALGGMVTALSLILLLLSMVLPLANMVFAALAGLLLISVVFELSEKWALLIFAAVSVLAIFIVPSKEPVVYYIFIFGHYPVLKSFIERIRNRVLNWVCKLAVFNIGAVAATYIVIMLMGNPGAFLKYGVLVTLLLANITFVIYDFAVSRLIVTYQKSVQKIFRRR